MSRIVKFLSERTGLRPIDIRSIIVNAPNSYKRYTIPKRSGGERPIAQPAREVKALQRILVSALPRLPIHQAATAYVKEKSIKDNAERHASNGPILKFDFVDFFGSVRESDWTSYCVRNRVFSEQEDLGLSAKLFFTRVPGSTILRLAIGAPSSPWMSNVLMYDFDEAVTRAVEKDKVTYTRYADDLTFSAKRTGFLNHVEKDLRKIISSLDSPRLKINEDKTVLATKKYRRVVTGLVLANDGRVTIGRERKRHLRAALHHAFLDKLQKDELLKLAGMVAYVKGVEPKYYQSLVSKFGSDIIEKLQQKHIG